MAGKKNQPTGPRGKGRVPTSKKRDTTRDSRQKQSARRQSDDAMDIDDRQDDIEDQQDDGDDRQDKVVYEAADDEAEYITILMTEWDRKDRAQQDVWVAAMEVRSLSQQLLEERQQGLQPQLQAIKDLQATQIKDILKYEDTVRDFILECVEWSDAAGQVVEGWQALERLETSAVEGGGSASGLNYVVKRREEAEEEQRRIWAEKVALEGELEKEDRDVPLDEQGRRRIPRQWNQKGSYNVKDSGMRAIRAEESQGDIGLRSKGRARNWIPCKILRRSLEVHGVLWLGLDEYDRVVDRVFRKDVFWSESRWFDPRFWDGDLRDPASLTPWEIASHEAMLAIPDLQHVVRLRESGRRELINHAGQHFRLYVERCPHADLFSLIRGFHESERPIPEPMIWCVAEALAESAVAMAEGSINEDEAVAGWREIIHLDIKPENIFLGLADSSWYPDYPKPLLADFGLSFRTPADNPHNPRWFIGSGTEGFFAPENVRHTNVWGIGQVLATMVLRVAYPEQPIWLGKGGDDELLYPPYLPMDDDDEKFAMYSHELRGLINACLVFNPANRPSAQALRHEIREHTREPAKDLYQLLEYKREDMKLARSQATAGKRKRSAGDDGRQARKKTRKTASNLAQGMRSGEAFRQGDAATARKLYGVPLPEDAYKLGMSREAAMAKARA